MFRPFAGKLGLALVCMAAPISAIAVGLPELLTPLVNTHERIVSAQAGVDAATNRARVALGDWFPTLDVTADFGHERQRKPGSPGSDLDFDEVKLKVTQLLWDFGATNAAVKKSEYDVTRAEVGLLSARQALILEAVGSYADLIRARDSLGFASESEDNIRKQTGLEEIRIEAGSGLSTDLLQAKTQLAGAQARRVDAQGSLETGINRYRALFGSEPPELPSLEPVAIDESRMPNSLDEAIEVALGNNPDLQDTLLAASSAQQDLKSAEASGYFPSLNGSFEQNYKENISGTAGFKKEQLWKVELSYPFNLGFTARNEVAAARLDLLAADANVVDTKRGIEQQVRDAWHAWKTAQQKAGFLADQARIAKAFLDLAVEERQLGQRSLIDVLSGETSWINAKSDAESARTDIVLAAADLLSAMGRLDLSAVVVASAANQIVDSAEINRVVDEEIKVDIPGIGTDQAANTQ